MYSTLYNHSLFSMKYVQALEYVLQNAPVRSKDLQKKVSVLQMIAVLACLFGFFFYFSFNLTNITNRNIDLVYEIILESHENLYRKDNLSFLISKEDYNENIRKCHIYLVWR